MLPTEKMDEYNVLMAMESFTEKLNLQNLEGLYLPLISTNRVSYASVHEQFLLENFLQQVQLLVRSIQQILFALR